MNQTDLLEKTEKRILEILSRVPTTNVLTVRKGFPIADKEIDISILIQIGPTVGELVVEQKNEGFPRSLRDASRWFTALKRNLSSDTALYFIVAAPYITDEGMNVCKEEGIGCIDLTGNCYLSFMGIYIEIRGNENPMPRDRSIKSLFSPRSSRVVRVLLADPKKTWKVQDIATTAKISIGLVSRMKTGLRDQALIQEEIGGIRVMDPFKLLNVWLKNYDYRKNERREWYSLESGSILEKRIGEYCTTHLIRYALGLFSGAQRVAPHIRMNKSFLYIDKITDEFVQELKLKPVDSGANLMVLLPYDDGVFFDLQEVEGIPIVSDIQLYLDLKTFKGRGEEAAEFLFNQRIKQQWSQS